MTRIYKCINCDESYTFWDGVGFLYPSVFSEVRTDAIEGRYGDDLQALIKENPSIVVDASNKIYFCTDCGYWNVEKSLDCYLPKGVITENENTKRWSVNSSADSSGKENRGYITVIPPWILKKGYKIISMYPHVCPHCGKKMRRYVNPPVDRKENGSSLLKLKCKKCGGEIISTKDGIYID